VRKKGQRFGGGTARVLGMLRLDDVVEGGGNGLVSGSDGIMVDEEDGIEGWFSNDEEGEGEVVDDITDLFSLDDDGQVFMIDSPSDTSNVVFESEGSILDDDEGDYDEDIFAGIEAEERLQIIGDMLAKEEESATTTTQPSIDHDQSFFNKETDSAGFMCVGNEIDVYIRGVFTQSGRFMVTLDPSIKDRKVKELKREREASKRLTRLAGKKDGEGKGLQHILDRNGMECNGTVKAKSKTGD